MAKKKSFFNFFDLKAVCRVGIAPYTSPRHAPCQGSACWIHPVFDLPSPNQRLPISYSAGGWVGVG